MDFSARYKYLNLEQRRAVDCINGPLLVLAGPGSGKTELLSIRAGNILRETDTPPGSILCLTYTDSASTNMKERLIGLIGEEAYKIPVHTFHGFCQKIMEDYPEYFHKGVSFRLADKAIQTKFLEEILEELDYENPLSSVHPEKGFAYLKDIDSTISDIKEGGLLPDDFKKILEENSKILEEIEYFIDDIFSERVSKKNIKKVEDFISYLESMKREVHLSHIKPLNKVIASSLKVILEEENKTTLLSQWKAKYTIKDGDKRKLKDLHNIEKMKSLHSVYDKYQKKMQAHAYYDFSDMILEVIKKMENNDSFYSSLRERYLYFLVDEFQDTNGVQMRFLNLLTRDIDNKPNICVVGDDDQGIYKFQGADISNILGFKETYSSSKVITLKNNYRSKKNILDLSYNIIKKGDSRLENILEEVDKSLLACNSGKGEIIYKNFDSEEEEISFVVEKVEERLKTVNPEEIAVIGRTHDTLTKAVPFFNNKKIPVFSERKENVLKKEHIIEIVNIMKFSNLLLEGDKNVADEFLPEILSYPFWGLKREDVWRISKEAYEKRKSWFECMKEDRELSEIANFLLDISLKSKVKPVEEIVDIIIGNKKGYFCSPFKKYYFSDKNFKEDKVNYLNLLSSLRCFIEATREHRSGDNIKVKDLIDFFNILEKNNIPLLDKSPLVSEKKAVSLITAHSAKGREFDSVFVLNCSQEVWGKGRPGGKISLFLNMPFKKAGDEKDDRLRLFYVTLTRAKNFLCLSSYIKSSNGRNFIPLEFLNDLKPDKDRKDVLIKNLTMISNNFYTPPFIEKEEDVILPLIENYNLSATGFTKFLNVAKEGPQNFFEDNILRFPKKKSIPLSYGTAVHEAISEIYFNLKKTGEVLSEEEFIKVFKKALSKERLTEEDYKKVYNRGKKSLNIFYKKRKEDFIKDYEVEKNFKEQECFLEDIKLTGKIDKMIKRGCKIEVTDFKTGKPIEKWDKKGEYERINIWKYKYQLIFYKFLLENAKDYKKFTVDKGFLEFVEPDKEGEIVILPLDINKEDTERVKKLIVIVGRKIKNMDFPSPEKYSQKKFEDIYEFENDLLKGNI